MSLTPERHEAGSSAKPAGHGLGRTRAKVLALLQSSPEPLPVTDVAEQLDLHPNSARFHLEGLVNAAFATRLSSPGGGPGRPRWEYRATDASPGVSQFPLLDLSRFLINNFVANQPDAAARAESAGFDWGKRAYQEGGSSADDPIEAKMLTLLQELAARGFVTTIAVGNQHIEVSRCPFRDAADSDAHLEILCAIHTGFIRGHLAAAGTGLTVSRLKVGNHICRISLSPKDDATGPSETATTSTGD